MPADALAVTGLTLVMTHSPGLAFNELEGNLRARFERWQQGGIGRLEFHGHGRPLQACDRAVTEGDGASPGIHAVDGAFGLVAGAFCRGSRPRNHFSLGGCRRWGAAEAADRCLEIALGIDQEVGGHHHLLAFLHALQNFHVGVAAGAQPDLARLKAPFALLDQHDLARAAVDDGRHRHGDHRAFGRDRHLHLREHGRLEQHAGVGQLHANRHGARFRLQRRIDIGHLAFEDFFGVGVDLDPGCDAGLDQPDVLLEDVGDHPD